MIINRHEFYDPSEVYRTLQPGGIFITQQVGSEDCIEMNNLLGAPNPDLIDPEWTVDHLAENLREIRFTILRESSDLNKTRLFDIGALIYFLKAIPWQIPDFSVEKFQTKLFQLHQTLQKEGYIDFTGKRYLIIAQKPKNG